MARPSMDQRSSGLTDNEGSILGLVLRRQPISTYQLMRVFSQSPVTGLNESKGTIYPVVRRLKRNQLIAARKLEGDKRNTELLSCTKQGRSALRAWLKQVDQTEMLLEDSLRTKLLSFELLSAKEQQKWISDAKAQLNAKIQEVESFGISLSIPFQDLVMENVQIFLNGRRRWLAALEKHFAASNDC